jgi:hypothetical protein
MKMTNVNFADDFNISQGIVKEKIWREKVNEVLGEEKKIRKIKNVN